MQAKARYPPACHVLLPQAHRCCPRCKSCGVIRAYQVRPTVASVATGLICLRAKQPSRGERAARHAGKGSHMRLPQHAVEGQ
ncbi:hypothetical protein ABIC35_000481 [Sphingomonas trueperi]